MIFFELFYTFFIIGLFTFGGGYAMIPLIEAQVTSKGWLEADALYEFIAISEVTPGPFAINIATFIGSAQGSIALGNNFGAFLGSLCATLGVLLPSFIIILLVAAIFKKIMDSKYVKGAMNGVKPIIIALISSVVILLAVKVIFFNSKSLTSEFIFDRNSLTLLIIMLFLYFLFKKTTKKGLSPVKIILLSALFGILIY